MTTSRRAFLGAVGASVAVSGCLGGGPDLPTETPTGPVATAPIPDAPDEYTYATMGAGDAPVTATYFGNWKCPYCADFSTGFLKDLVSEYVQPGDVALKYRGLAYINGKPFLGSDAPRATRAGLAVWNEDPESYWRYHEYVMANQPPEANQWATTKTLTAMAKRVGVSNADGVKSALTDGTYETPVKRTSTAASKAGVTGTPLLRVGDTLVSPFEKTKTREALDEAVASATESG